jgi:tape measure domain-containing protein
MVSDKLRIEVEAEVKRAMKNLNQVRHATRQTATAASDVSKKFDMVRKAALFGFGTIVAKKIFDVAAASVQAAAAFEKQQIAFETLLGSADKAGALLNEIEQFAATTPFEQMGLMEGAKRLMAFGTAADDVVETMRNLGNAAMGNQATMERLIDAYGKMRAKGKVTLEELNRFMEAGVPILDALAERYDTTTQNMLEMITKGKVMFEDVDAALKDITTGEGKFAGMIEKQSQSLSGLLSTMNDNFSILARTIGEELMPVIKPFVEGVIETTQKLTEGIKAPRKLAEATEIYRMAMEGQIKDLSVVNKAIEIINREMQRYQENIEDGGRAQQYANLINKKGTAELQNMVDGLKRYSTTLKNVKDETEETDDSTDSLTDSQKLYFAVLGEIQKEMELASQKASVFGEQFDLTAAKTDVLTEAINTLLESDLGFTAASPGIQKLRNDLEALGETGEKTGKIMAESFGPTAGEGANFADMFGAGSMAARDMSLAMTTVEMKMAKLNEKSKEYAATLTDDLTEAVATFHQTFSEGLGQMIVSWGEGVSSMKEAYKGLVATALEAAAQLFMAQAAGYIFINPAAAAGLFAAGTAAYVAAGAVKALAEGGIVTQPTMAMVGERGPEAVIPLDKMGKMGDTYNIYNIRGSYVTEREMAKEVTKHMRQMGGSF